MDMFEKSRSFIYRNARPLELALFQFHFEKGTIDNVLKALLFYQNSDGGFGHSLEADCWNPNSSPIQTSTACDIISTIGLKDSDHPIVQDILSYFANGDSFDNSRWFACIESNDQYPHAMWWNSKNIHWHNLYNPTAHIAGFIIEHAKRGSDLYSLGVRIAKEAVDALLNADSIDMGVCSCYIKLKESLKKANASDIIPYEVFSTKLHEFVHSLINTDIDAWGTYTCKPSQFILSRSSEFYEENRTIAEYECDYIIENQLKDGSWDISWTWNDYPDQWGISKNWWKSTVIIQNLLYLKGFGKI